MHCPWLRGSPPVVWHNVEDERDRTEVRDFGGLSIEWSTILHDGAVWGGGDGSGGNFSCDPRVRRVALRWIAIHCSRGIANACASTWRVAGGQSGPVAGKQSINMAETIALKQFLKLAPGKVCFVTDSTYVFRGFLNMQRGRMPSTHTDVWRETATLRQSRPVPLVKLERHLAAQEALDLGYPRAARCAQQPDRRSRRGGR